MGGSAHKATQHAHNDEETTNTSITRYRSQIYTEKDADIDFLKSKDADADHWVCTADADYKLYFVDYKFVHFYEFPC